MIGRLLRDVKGIAQAEFKSSEIRSLARAMVLDAFPILVMTRIREASRQLRIPAVNRCLRMMQMVMYGVEIGKDVELGDGVTFVHSLGTVVGGTSRVGRRVRFMGNNTVGTAKDNGSPIIEDDVVVGCGARVLGPIRVGAGAVIGANSVVLSDVDPGDVVAGAPARSLRMRSRPGPDKAASD
jgi:serine O-acetyltransferase